MKDLFINNFGSNSMIFFNLRKQIVEVPFQITLYRVSFAINIVKRQKNDAIAKLPVKIEQHE